MTEEEEKRMGEIVDDLIDKRIIELMDCPGCKLLLKRLSAQECVISRQKKRIESLENKILRDTVKTLVCSKCMGKGLVQFDNFGGIKNCPDCNGLPL